ncbi:basic helix-loop-helix (bHLH) DNA-binding superfamily protein [Tasmannia lanceolata]|uniref:basic helix-loop-helix (bHLH) DNA-binding superfamily protein n=1 Tax=Tasmannia lanceolata TaxID=3420 RepID=UPI0040637E1B
MEQDFPTMFSTASFPPFPTGNLLKTLHYGQISDAGSSQLGHPADLARFGYFPDDLTAIFPGKMIQGTNNVDQRSEMLKLPKPEPVDKEHFISVNERDEVSPTQPLHIKDPSLNLCSTGYFRLPDLRCLETLPELVEEPPLKSIPAFHALLHPPFSGANFPATSSKRFSPPTPDLSLSGSLFSHALKTPDPPFLPAAALRNKLARQRRKKISDRMRSLEKLMPWDRKMDTALMLEEAYKYIKFLHAQVSALRSMPCNSNISFASSSSSSSSSSNLFSHLDVNFLGLEKLNRQQLLQVMVNSPVVQDQLYSKGFCVFSAEQVFELKNMAERNVLVQQNKLFG